MMMAASKVCKVDHSWCAEPTAQPSLLSNVPRPGNVRDAQMSHSLEANRFRKKSMRAIIALPLLGLLTLGGCAQPQNILSEGPAISDTSSEGVVHRSVADYGGDKAESTVINSDNKSVVRRSGISSDARNPSGMPGRPTSWWQS
jgi:hypothetical protein